MVLRGYFGVYIMERPYVIYKGYYRTVDNTVYSSVRSWGRDDSLRNYLFLSYIEAKENIRWREDSN